jgi:hypothetical protein
MSFYKHKFGAEKRKLKLEKEAKAISNTQVISTFFKSVQTNTHSVKTIPYDDKVLQIDVSEPSCNTSKVEKRVNENASACSSREIECNNFTDPGLWPEQINDDIRQKIINANPSNFDNLLKIKSTISKDLGGKQFSEFLLYTKSSNNREKHPRDWLIYSTFKKTLNCFSCLLFNDKLTAPIKNRSVLTKRSGFSPKIIPWKKLGFHYMKIVKHIVLVIVCEKFTTVFARFWSR